LDLRPEAIRKELEDSLLRLGTERIDIYQCHWPDPETPIELTLEEMLKMQSEGKVNAIGVSNFDVPLLERASNAVRIASVQPQYSLVERAIEDTLLPFCSRKGIGVMTYGSLGSGILSGKYEQRPTFKKNDARSYFYGYYREPLWGLVQELLTEVAAISLENGKPVAQVAINWIVQRVGVTTAIVGARTLEQIAINAGAVGWNLSEGDIDRIDDAYHRIFNSSSTQDL
jgi:aryl-alcohol dehydrogenase-like predicted oxidoreductase